MTEVRKESISALIDGEASELEVHRLVREFRTDGSLTRSWAAYQQIRTTLGPSGPSDKVLSAGHHETLFARISDAVEREENGREELVYLRTNSNSPKKLAFGSLALAASMVVAVFVGLQQQPAEISGPQMAEAAMPRGPVVTQHVANSQPLEIQTPELVELDEEKQRRLRAYLNQHEMAREMNSRQQLVNYPGNTAPTPRN